MPLFTIAQNNSTSDIDSIAGRLIKNLRSNTKEKILLQTDRKVCGAGETMWFKAYIVDSLNNKLTDKSKILFVDLVDDKDSLLTQLLFHAERLKTHGAILLSDSLYEGYYWLRAYTRKMIKENVGDISVQPVYVVNPKKKNGSTLAYEVNNTSEAATGVQPILDIYPEGGSLISGTNTTVAVKAHGQELNPLVVSGIVKDSRDTIVAKFSTNDQGLGKFSFSPTWFGKYRIYIQTKDRYDSMALLPRVNPYAAQLSVTEQNDQSIKARVMLEDSIFTNDYTTYILGISKDSICFAGVGRGMYELNIPVSNFPSGVATLLLFNAKKQLVSERNIYISKKDYNLNIGTDKENYTARENVKMNIDLTDAAGKPLMAALAVSVIDSRIADTTDKLFSDPLQNHSFADVDLIMLTKKGFYKDWMDEHNINATPTGDTDDVLTLKGKVVNRKKEPLSNMEVVLMSNKNNVLFIQDTTDANGRFIFLLPDYDDSTQFNLQVNNLKGVKEDYDILIDPLDLPHFATPSFLKQKFISDEAELVKNIKAYHIDSVVIGSGRGWLAPVTVTTTDEKESGKKKKNNSSDIITREMLQAGGVNNVGAAVLRSGKLHLIGGYLMSGGPNAFAPSPLDEPNVIMDGIQVSIAGGVQDATERSPVLAFLKTISTDQVDYIRVLTGNEAGIYGVRSGHGVIEIHTSSKLTNYATTNGIKTIVPQGFYVAPSFKMPDYNNKEIKYSKFPDQRLTVYWNGDLITDNNGKANINFFTADAAATYIVTITGVTVNGNKIYKTIVISRK